MTIKRFISSLMFILPDSVYLRIKYYIVFHKALSLKRPKTYSEKLQWLKINNKNELYTTLVDKIESKKYVENLIGKKYVIPTLAIWDKAEDIDVTNLPSQFVIKCNHDSHSVFVVSDKPKFDIETAKQSLKKALTKNYFIYSREYPYKKVQKRVFAEKFMKNQNDDDLIDYKFFCFSGQPKFVGICTNRMKDLTWDLFDLNFNHINVNYVTKSAKIAMQKPERFEEMIDIATKLSKDIPHVRIDLYEINGEVFFGEFTFFSSGGFAPFTPESYDYKFGDYITVI